MAKSTWAYFIGVGGGAFMMAATLSILYDEKLQPYTSAPWEAGNLLLIMGIWVVITFIGLMMALIPES